MRFRRAGAHQIHLQCVLPIKKRSRKRNAANPVANWRGDVERLHPPEPPFRTGIAAPALATYNQILNWLSLLNIGTKLATLWRACHKRCGATRHPGVLRSIVRQCGKRETRRASQLAKRVLATCEYKVVVDIVALEEITDVQGLEDERDAHGHQFQLSILKRNLLVADNIEGGHISWISVCYAQQCPKVSEILATEQQDWRVRSWPAISRYILRWSLEKYIFVQCDT